MSKRTPQAQRVSELGDPRMLLLALGVGTFAGLGAVFLAWLLDAVHDVGFETVPRLLAFLGPYAVVLVPAFGGLLVGPLVFYLAREARGHGVPEVLLAVETAQGRIRPRVAAVKALASAISIGTGGSAGREGPVVQIGAGLGSTIAQLLRLPDDQTRLLLAAGAAGGIAATFNAPIAGVMFAVEIILRRFSARNFTVIFISSVTATGVYASVLGDRATLVVPPYALNSPLELPVYAVLGAVAAIVGMAFVWMLYAAEDAFESAAMPRVLKPALGGLVVGLIGLWSMEPLGAGIDGIERAAGGEFALWTLLGLGLAKMVATSFTLGSGGSGGVFAPSLFIGATLGGAFGIGAHTLLPDIARRPEAYAVVGMAATFAASARAPITAVLIIFEITRDYGLILPRMAAVAIATVGAQLIDRETIYTLKLIRRGIDIQRERTGYLLDGVPLVEVMRPVSTLPATLTIDELARWFSEAETNLAVVQNGDGEFLGVLTTAEVEARLAAGDTELTAGALAHRDFTRLHPDQTIHEALTRPDAVDVESIAIVSREDPTNVIGVVSRRDMLRTYSQLARRPGEIGRRSQLASLFGSSDTLVASHLVTHRSWLDGRLLKDVTLPLGSLIVSIRRRGRTLIPRGQVRLQPGDLLVVLALRSADELVRTTLAEGPPPPDADQSPAP